MTSFTPVAGHRLLTERPGALRHRTQVIIQCGVSGASSPRSDRIRPGQAQSASGGLEGAHLHAMHRIAAPMSGATRQVVCLQDLVISEHLEPAELRSCYRLDPNLPTNRGSRAPRRQVIAPFDRRHAEAPRGCSVATRLRFGDARRVRPPRATGSWQLNDRKSEGR
jgi:hypothetical protein